MRRSEARQGVRMLKFMDVFGRWDAAELNQMEAAELLADLIEESASRLKIERREAFDNAPPTRVFLVLGNGIEADTRFRKTKSERFGCFQHH